MSVYFLPSASMSKVVLNTINCNRSLGFLVLSAISSLPASCVACLCYSQPNAAIKCNLLKKKKNVSLLLSRGAPKRADCLQNVCLFRILSKGKMRMYLRRGCLAPAYLIVTQGCILYEWKQECGFKISHSEKHCLLIKSYVVMCL